MKGSRYAVSVKFALCVALALTLGGCASTGSREDSAASGGRKAPAGFRYVCNCGPECKCGSNASLPGACTCGKPMVQKKVLAETEKNYLVCAQESPCKELRNPDDNSHCSHRQRVQAFPKVGYFSCACPDCPCDMQANRAGNCTCGKEMQQPKK